VNLTRKLFGDRGGFWFLGLSFLWAIARIYFQIRGASRFENLCPGGHIMILLPLSRGLITHMGKIEGSSSQNRLLLDAVHGKFFSLFETVELAKSKGCSDDKKSQHGQSQGPVVGQAEEKQIEVV
jgi:hypothetical protein